jgi:hypothetical protein
VETTVDQASISTPRPDVLEYLVRNFGKFSISSLTQTQKHLKTLESNLGMTKFSESASKPLDNCGPSLVGGFKTCAIHSDHKGGGRRRNLTDRRSTRPNPHCNVRGEDHTQASVRLLRNASDSPRMVTMMGPLPYQTGVTLSVMGEATNTEPCTEMKKYDPDMLLAISFG